jgi:TatD DNase family protein
MIDSHCHLTDSKLLDQIDAVLDRAKNAGVDRIMTIGVDPADNQLALKLAGEKPSVRCALGIHPNYCHEVDESELPKLRELLTDPRVLAVGETGLDDHYDFSDRKRQQRFFEQQVIYANEVNKPIVIHSRETVDDCLAVLKGFPKERAVFHCFTGSIAEGERIIEAGFLLGFTGVITFKKSEPLRELIAKIPADRFLIETDAPWLSPEPLRKNKVNEPSFMIHTAATIATARGISTEDVDRLTTGNTERFYGKW